jgi:acyl phosphate:glycerol-3-phosphate acyltransferase
VSIVLVVLSYAIGCVSPCYLLVRRATGADLRAEHTGSTGARNAGRVAGKRVAAAVFLLDAAKGAVALGVARIADPGDSALAACLVAVVAGHVFPVQLRFRGGRGLSTALGALLVLDPLVALIGLAIAPSIAAATRALVWAGIAAAVAVPVAAALTGGPQAEVAGLIGVAVVVAPAHVRTA